jgi:hypothetical protein
MEVPDINVNKDGIVEDTIQEDKIEEQNNVDSSDDEED